MAKSDNFIRFYENLLPLYKHLNMLKTCLYTGEQFVPTRKNQIFATAKHRRDFHNEIAAELRRIKAPIDKALEKNFLILTELVQEGEAKTFEKEHLNKKGYNTSFFTHLDNYQGKYAMCLYHFIILKTENPNSLTVIYPKKDA